MITRVISEETDQFIKYDVFLDDELIGYDFEEKEQIN